MFSRAWNWIKSLFKKKDVPVKESESDTTVVSPPSQPPSSAPLTALYTEGNKIMRDGKPFILRGVNIPDASYCNLKDWEGFGTFEENVRNVKSKIGGNVIRIPVLPGRKGGKEAWFGLGADKYWNEHLLPAIKLCNELNYYAIIDFHYISDWNDLVDETIEFWKYVAPKIAGMDMVLAEVFNEPINSRGWINIRDKLQLPCIKVIRDAGFTGLIIYSTPGWTSDLDDIKQGEQITLPNTVASYHGYQNQYPDMVKKNIEHFYNMGPILYTELGWQKGSHEGGTSEGYGRPLLDYLATKGIGWTAWCHDRSGEWQPQLINTGTWDLSESGKVVAEYLRSL